MTDITANLGLPVIAAAQAQKHVTHNEALRLIDTLVQLAVLDRDLADPPGSPNEGERWIVAASPTDEWAGHADDIAAWQDGAWQFSTPQTGWVAFVADEGTLLVWNGSAWGDFFSTVTSIQNLARLGVGTTADATNPFAAKLNNALWAAKTAAEGGDGDLRSKMSKESAADVLSLLMQTNFSGRAEIGLIGDDDLTVKVSADGSAWSTALVADRSSGAVRFPNTVPSAYGLILPQTRALVGAMSSEPRRARTFLSDDLIAELIDEDIWDDLDLLYIMAAHDEQAARINWKNPGTFTLTAVNSPNFLADRGFKGDGSTARLTTDYIPSTHAVNYAQDDASIWFWSLENIGAHPTGEIGRTTSAPSALLTPRSGADAASYRINDATSRTVASTDSTGLWGAQRTGATARRLWRNDAEFDAGDSEASTGLPTAQFWVCGTNGTQFGSRRLPVAAVAASLAGKEAAFHAALGNYLSEIGAI